MAGDPDTWPKPDVAGIHPEVDKTIPPDECGAAFRKAMKGRHYGHDASLSAWGWFQAGWDAAEAADRAPS